MNYVFKNTLLLIWALVCIMARAEGNYTYDTREWLNLNSAAVQMLNNDRSGSIIPFKPCLINNDFVAAKCKIVEYYDCAIYFDPDKRAVIYVDDKARADYYVIFADATNVNMGAGNYELFIECNISPSKSYDLIYNVRTNQARKLADGDVSIISRFARRLPHINYKNPHDKVTKLLHDYFKELAAGNYVDAQKARRKLIMKANQDQGLDSDVLDWDNTTIFNSYPLVELGEALMLSYPTKYRERDALSIARDPFRGYNYVKQVYRLDTLLNEANSVLLSGDIRLSVDMIKKNVENELINYARWEGTEQAYDRVLMTLYNSPLRADARTEQEKIVYSRIAGSSSKDDFMTYLNKFKGVDDGHYNFIEQRMFQLAYEQMPQTADGCKEFLKNYPFAPQAGEVRKKMSEYAYMELQPTVESCRNFLNEYPQSPHAEEVWYRVYELAYNEIGDDIERCDKYLADYPNSQYCDQVRWKKQSILNRRYAEENGELMTDGADVPIQVQSSAADVHNAPERQVKQPAEKPLHQSTVQPAAPASQPASQAQQSKPAAKPVEPGKQKSNSSNSTTNSTNSNSSTGTLWELDF